MPVAPGLHPSRTVRRRIERAVIALVSALLLLALAGCGGDGDAGSEGGSGSDAAATAGAGGDAGSDAGDDETGEGSDTGSDTGSDGGSDTGTDTGSEDARFNLVASPDNAECSYVPNGHLSGADLLNVHFYFLIIGGNPPDVPAVSVNGRSDTGLTTSYSSGPHNQALSTAQFALRGEDFGRSHSLTITVDAAGQVPETDESDNRIGVTVSLPSPRPSSTVDPLACSIARAT